MSSIDEACVVPSRAQSDCSAPSDAPLDIDRPCENEPGNVTARVAALKPDRGQGDVQTQTRRQSSTATETLNSQINMKVEQEVKEALKDCDEKFLKVNTARNPITGCGLGSDGVGGLKPKKPRDRRDGNPVTGEGYMNGANQVINKNRIPPGGYSSGLW